MDNILQNLNFFSILLILTGIILFQIYYLVVSIFVHKVISGSLVVILITVFLVNLWNIMPSILGYPFVSSTLPEKFKLIDYISIPEESKILVWLKVKESNRPRVYEIKMNVDLRKKLRKAKERGVNNYTFVKSKIGKKFMMSDTEKYDLQLNIKPIGLPDYKNG
jgi:hypothetical protein